ncbi:hypothetical protein [Streptomyces sp. NPDC096339]|uniref:hypothetical protein n=1 Tax=Streptomyces sp. NPDC096339 TaxID=3366086 RepID=UPI0037F3987C
MRGLALASKIVVAGLAGAFLTMSAVRAEPARPASDHDAHRDAPAGVRSEPPPVPASASPSGPASARPSASPSVRPSASPTPPPSPSPGASKRP